jgi:hypothetical protein
MNPLNILLICLIIAALAYLTYNMYSKKSDYEHFTEGETPTSEEEDNYASRLNVMKVFDAVLNRKPTVDEIDQYAITNNEQDLITKVYENYQNEIKEKLTQEPEQPVEDAAAPTQALAAAKAALQKDTIGKNIAEVIKDIKPDGITSTDLEEKVKQIVMESTELTIYSQTLVDLSDKLLKGQKSLSKMAGELISEMSKYSQKTQAANAATTAVASAK